jgi:hypothetical protein
MSVALVQRREQPPDLAERMAVDKIRITITDPSSRPVPRVFPPLWRVVVRLGGRTLRLPYYAEDLLAPPTPLAIMRELVLAAQSVEDAASLHDWANVPEEAPVDIKIEQTYARYVTQTARLRRLLGDRYDAYLRNTVL